MLILKTSLFWLYSQGAWAKISWTAKFEKTLSPQIFFLSMTLMLFSAVSLHPHKQIMFLNKKKYSPRLIWWQIDRQSTGQTGWQKVKMLHSDLTPSQQRKGLIRMTQQFAFTYWSAATELCCTAVKTEQGCCIFNDLPAAHTVKIQSKKLMLTSTEVNV